MSRPLQMELLKATNNVADLPPSQAEVTFIGRSNVGKSSLLNAIAGQKKVADVSKNPGRTKALWCFALDGGKSTLVDCPGYGFAKVAKSLRQKWLPMLEAYLLEREPLSMVMLLVDGEVGPTASDLDMLHWLRVEDIPHSVVATKRDKVKPSKRVKREREFATKCQMEHADILWVSAKDNFGIVDLRERVREWLAPQV